jgi:hypothetical protein
MRALEKYIMYKVCAQKKKGRKGHILAIRRYKNEKRGEGKGGGTRVRLKEIYPPCP